MALHTLDYQKPDGRRFRFFSHQPFNERILERLQAHPGILRPGEGSSSPWRVPELRMNPLTGELVSLSASRQGRPHLPAANQCPLCRPHSVEDALLSELPMALPTAPPFEYDLVSFENLFPALSPANESGICEVILYSTDHNTHFSAMSHLHVQSIIEVWQDRSRSLGNDPNIQCVFIFENRGAEIGVTLHHPHGQVYAFNHIPPRLKLQLDHADRYYASHMSCLVCDLAKHHSAQTDLILWKGEHLVAYMPQAPRFPYEIHITTLRHRPHIEDLEGPEVTELAGLLKSVVAMYDRIFDFPLPYIMQHHQSPSHAKHLPSFHWNLQITPFHRSATKLKFLAGAETGMGFFVNDSFPEEKILELRKAFVWDLG
jgi:UDPglucose--hexose-1-phosphate uridylyltransferase